MTCWGNGYDLSRSNYCIGNSLKDCEVAILTHDKFLALLNKSPAVIRLQNIMKERLKNKKEFKAKR